MSATANEKDIAMARHCVDLGLIPQAVAPVGLAECFAAVRAPLEARIAELDAALADSQVQTLCLEARIAGWLRHTAKLEARIAELEAYQGPGCNDDPVAVHRLIRENALRKAAEVAGRHGEWPARDILALIEAPAVKP
jgi:BMFP domain-containing protein YqiC